MPRIRLRRRRPRFVTLRHGIRPAPASIALYRQVAELNDALLAAWSDYLAAPDDLALMSRIHELRVEIWRLLGQIPVGDYRALNRRNGGAW